MEANSLEHVPKIRIFLSSPGDVRDERELAIKVINELQYDPYLRGRVAFEMVAWDMPGTDTPMLATMTPQAAIDAGLPKPSACDIVVVLFWSRMGTPLPHPQYQKPNGDPYYSGTEWEFDDARQAALKAGKPYVVVYRRMEEPVIGLDDPELDKKHEQRKRVKAFFSQFTDAETGAIYGGINEYIQPNNFRDKLETHLKELTRRLLEKLQEPTAAAKASEEAPLWQGSPFPGLRAFTPADAPIFFGRGAETDRLVKRLSDPGTRLVAVVGASGAGKSSLVGAGLIPRLQANAIEGSSDWLLPEFDTQTGQWVGARFAPGDLGDNPFMALSVKLGALARQQPRELAEQIEKDPNNLTTLVDQILSQHPDWSELLLFIDQFEELFTLVQPHYIAPFVDMLTVANQTNRLRTVLTLRADFYARCVEIPKLANLLESTTYPLPTPTQVELNEMITRPADRAGLIFESGLAERILKDTGDEPGALALMAYALDELYHTRQNDQNLTLAAYENLGGVQGAIGKRADAVYAALAPDVQAALPRVFRELVEVDDERGEPTRRRARLSDVATDPAAATLVEAFTGERARLLVQSRSEEGDEPIVEVAHEALLRSWERLSVWIEAEQDNLRLRRQIGQAAREWQKRGWQDDWLLAGGRLEEALGWRARFPAGELENEFINASLEFAKQQVRFKEKEQAERLLLAERAEIAERDRARRYQRWTAVAAVISLVALGLFVFGQSQLTESQTQVANNRLEAERFSTLEAGDVIVPLLTQTPDQFIPTLTKIAVLTAHDPSLAENHLTDDFGVEMVYVPEGCFFMGSDRGLVDEQPSHQVCLDAFWIDRYEVTNEQFGRLNGVANLVGDWPQPLQPRTSVNWFEARNFCESRGARLPTEAEWEYAARGPDSRIYPWGNEFVDPNENVAYPLTHHDTPAELAVDQRPGGVSWVGAYDMSGNVWEWVSTIYDQDRFPYPYETDDGREDMKNEDMPRVMRGGGIHDFDDLLRSAKRSFTSPSVAEHDVGFRCARADSPTQ